MSSVVYVLGALAFAFLLRYLPHVLAPLGIGVDHWYWRRYIEKYRAEGKFPPDLPQYLLESAQWYPPLFPLVLALLPSVLFDRFSHLLAIVIDLFRVASVMAIVHSLTGGDAVAVGVAGAVYAVTPLLVSYNVQLNPRGLAALMLDLALYSATLIFFFNGPAWLWLVLVPTCGLILLTHKMTTQLFWFLCLAGAVLDWKVALLIPLSIVVALAMSKGFYWKVLLAHWDIVAFWYRNWPWAGANPVKESPIYGVEGYETPRKIHRKGAAGIAKHVFTQMAYNPFAWLLMALLLAYPFLPVPLGGFPLFVIGGLALTLAFGLATALVPAIRCLGAGHLYLYNAAFPSALVWGLLYDREAEFILPFLAVGFAASLLAIVRYYVHVKQSPTLKIDPDFDAVLSFLAAKDCGAVMCVPPQWYDVVAYKTGLPVLFGGHGYGFKLLEDTFPRLLIPVAELVRRYGMRYVLIEEGAVTEKFLRDLPPHTTREFGKYRVLSLDPSARSAS